jgi:putative hydrolase of the HAD superfamily
MERPIRAVLFDFFGTLVTYEPDRRRLGYPETHGLLRRWGHAVTGADLVARWDAASAALEARSAIDLREFTMLDSARAFAAEARLELSDDRCAELAASFVAEWQVHVRPVDGAAELLERLSSTYRLGVVSNTHDPDMVPAMVRSMGFAPHVEVSVLSVDHGRCKPHPSIYESALDRLGNRPDQVAFVGDSYDADYVGPAEVGMAAFLIDPGRRHQVPDAARLDSVLDVEARLASIDRVDT